MTERERGPNILSERGRGKERERERQRERWVDKANSRNYCDRQKEV